MHVWCTFVCARVCVCVCVCLCLCVCVCVCARVVRNALCELVSALSTEVRCDSPVTIGVEVTQLDDTVTHFHRNLKKCSMRKKKVQRET
jgi:hypothetical protein